MRKLIEGIQAFQSEYFPMHQEFFEKISLQQKPLALCITCADSRVNPNLITNTQPGELFILRNAGNLVPPHGSASMGGEAATIEYAIAGLDIEHVIICGHTGCGAMLAMLEPQLTEKVPRMRQWLSHAEATSHIMHESHSHLEGTQRLDVAVEQNVLVQLENLKTHPVVAARLAAGRLKLHGWVYNIKTGAVTAYDATLKKFVSVTNTDHGPSREVKPHRIGERATTASQRIDHGHELTPAHDQKHEHHDPISVALPY